MINLSSVWSMLFLYLAYEETLSYTLLAYEIIIIPTANPRSLNCWQRQDRYEDSFVTSFETKQKQNTEDCS